MSESVTDEVDTGPVVSVKCVLVGDSCVGKSCMRMTLEMDTYPERLSPTVVDHCLTRIDVDGKPVNLDIWDTAGVCEYDRLRRHTYPKTDVFIICFSLVAPYSLDNVRDVWSPEIAAFCPVTPVILVGTKMDMREEQSSPEMTKGFNLALAIGAINYLECSALKNQGVKEVFQEAARIALGNTPKTRESCIIS